MKQVTRPCLMTRPDFFHEVDTDAGTITYRSDVTGSRNVFDANDHKLIESVRQVERVPIAAALQFEQQFVRIGDKPSPLMAGDKHDTTKAAGTTGGGRRSFISVAFERAVLGLQDGADALHDWAVDQGQRPTAWLPFDFRYDGYFGRHAATKWQYDTPDQDGWSIFRADHIESAPLFGGAAIGEDAALAASCELLKWTSRTFWNPAAGALQKGWHGSRQKRAMGWMLWWYGRAALLGFDSAEPQFVQDYLGITPKVMLRELVDDLWMRPPRLGEFAPDDRTMVDLKNGEIRGELTFQWAIYFAAIGWIDRLGIMTSKRWREVFAAARALANDVADRAVGPGGIAYAFSAGDGFSAADLAMANSAEKDKSHVYELVGGVIRDTPRAADAELLCGGLGLLMGERHAVVEELLGKIAAPDNMAKYDDIARYVDPIHALRGASG